MNQSKLMKTSLLLTALSLIVAPFVVQASESAAERDQRMAWFRDARFGLFIHWGVYSVPAGEWNGKTNYGEWFLEETKMPVSQYEKFAGQFNPVKFDAKEWVRLAKQAGMKYIVITSKHHDGFCMFDTAQTDHRITARGLRPRVGNPRSQHARRVDWTAARVGSAAGQRLEFRTGRIGTLADVPDVATLSQLQTNIVNGALGLQNIRSDWVGSPLGGAARYALPRSFTVLGQKFVPDSWAFSQTVYDSILWVENGVTNKVQRRVPGALDAAFAAAESADACLIVGSTGVVYPAAEIPIIAKQAGARIIEIDPGDTEFSSQISELHIRLGASEAMARLDELVKDGIA